MVIPYKPDIFFTFPETNVTFIQYLPRVPNTKHAFLNIVNKHGVRGLWKGWAPNVQRAALVNMGGKKPYNYTTLLMHFCRNNYIKRKTKSINFVVVSDSDPNYLVAQHTSVLQAPVIQTLDSTVHQINHCLMDKC